MPPPPKKRILAEGLDRLGVNQLLLGLQSVLFRPHIRAVNYHSVPESGAENFEKQLEFYQRHFAPVSYRELVELVEEGRWTKRKPGLIISFDDGLRDNAEIAAPLLERYGFVGWFLLPVGFLDAPPASQPEFARSHQITPVAIDRDDPRIAMTWEQVARLSERHVVGCHTYSHPRLQDTLTDEELDREILAAKRRMEEQLGREIPVFGWVGGEEWSYGRRAAEAIYKAGFKASFMTNHRVIRPGDNLQQLQRTNVESDFGIPVLRFQISGIMDLLYTRKRRRINRKTHIQ